MSIAKIVLTCAALMLSCSKPTTATSDAASTPSSAETCTFAGRYPIAYSNPQGTCGDVRAQTLTVTGAGAAAKMTVEGGQLEGGGAVFDAVACSAEFGVTVQDPGGCDGQRTLHLRVSFKKAVVEGTASASGTCKKVDCSGTYVVTGPRQ